MALHVTILSPSQKLFSADADELIAPSIQGEVGILPQHADYITLLTTGRLMVRQGSKTTAYEIEGGLCSVSQDQVTVLADGAKETH